MEVFIFCLVRIEPISGPISSSRIDLILSFWWFLSWPYTHVRLVNRQELKETLSAALLIFFLLVATSFPLWYFTLKIIDTLATQNSEFCLLNLARLKSLFVLWPRKSLQAMRSGIYRDEIICFYFFRDHCPVFPIVQCPFHSGFFFFLVWFYSSLRI